MTRARLTHSAALEATALVAMTRFLIVTIVVLVCACVRASSHDPRVAFDPPDWTAVVQRSILEWWWPRASAAIQKNDPECRYLAADRRTVVEYVVDPTGVITAARIKESSGVSYLDQLALDAFMAVHQLTPPPARFANQPLLNAFLVRERRLQPICPP
jgi:TonB family protein